MQNAKCKMNEAFCFAKAYFMVRFFDQTPEKHCPVWNIHSRKPLSYRRFVLDFAFCILHFAFRSQTDNPKFEDDRNVTPNYDMNGWTGYKKQKWSSCTKKHIQFIQNRYIQYKSDVV